MIRMTLIPLAFERKHHIVGVQRTAGRKIRGRVKEYAGTQFKGIDPPVFGNLPAFRQGGYDTGTAWLKSEQPVVDCFCAGIERSMIDI